MNPEHFKELLLKRRNALRDDVKRYDEEVLEAPVAEVGDDADLAVTDLAKSEAADLSSTANGELGLVEDALKRIDAGTYGTCIECGEQIAPARLEAVPWTPYCLQDQEYVDRAEGMSQPATL